MKKSSFVFLIAIIIIVLAGGWYWWQYQPDQVTSTRYNPDDFKTANSNLFPGVTIDQENKWENDMAIAVQYPRTPNEKVNTAIKKFVDDTIADFETEADQRPQVKDWDDELHVTFVTSGLAPNLLSVKFYVNEYFTDNDHPRHDIVTKLYDLDSGKTYSLADIFVDDVDYQTQLHLLAADALYKDEEIKDKTRIHQEAGPEDDDFSRFTLDFDSLTFYFVKGELADHLRQIDIPYSKLLDSLAPVVKNHLGADGKTKESSRVSQVTPTPTATPVPTATPAPTPTPTPAPNPAGQTCVALTFDDGPHAVYTPQKLDILKEKNVPATFFMIGNVVGAHPDLVKQILAAGHELGNHSWDHAQLSRLSAADIQSQMSQTQAAIKQAAGVAPTVMRPPYGAINETVEQNVGLPIILWSVDPNDWKDRDRDTVLQRVVANTKPGSIVLMHDIYGSTADALGEIIDQLKAKGYCFQTVSDLLGFSDDTSAQAGQVYRQK